VKIPATHNRALHCTNVLPTQPSFGDNKRQARSNQPNIKPNPNKSSKKRPINKLTDQLPQATNPFTHPLADQPKNQVTSQ